MNSEPKSDGASGDKVSTVKTVKVPFDDYKVFNDPIHGHILLHPLLVKIVDTQQFQRLRNIKQLGGAYYVYSGASHNRFEHSLGVSHLAEKLTRMLQERQIELNITEEDILCVAMAGLCHDLGHGPFSHLFDNMFLPEVRRGCAWKHERGSCEMLQHLINVNGLMPEFQKYGLDEADVLFVKEMIVGENPEGNPKEKTKSQNKIEWKYKGRKMDKSFLYDIVSNETNKMDVDKWDYFARDCHHLGIRNSFDHTRFMQFMKVLPSQDGRLHLCARDKEHVNLNEMFHTRRILHQRAYQHRACVAIELMMSKALVKANDYITIIGTDDKPFKLSECINDPVAYTRLNDTIFDRILNLSKSEIEQIAKACGGQNEARAIKSLEAAKSLLQRVQRRQLFTCIGGVSLEGGQKCKFDVKDIVKYDRSLQEEHVILRGTKINYGKGNENPVDSFQFFRKSDTQQAQIIPKEEVSKMLPEDYEEKKMLVWCTSTNADIKVKAKACWDRWKLKNPQEDTLDVTWTPMRQDGRNRTAHIETGRPKRRKLNL